MNAGLSNLTTLKAFILSAALRSATDYDATLTLLGLGVAAQMEKYCGRKFAYLAGQQDVFGADRVQFLLTRFPVITPITTVEFKLDEPTGWVTQDQSQPLASANTLVIQSVNAAAGIVTFPEATDCGPWWSQMRFTYTGGFFFEQLEPADGGYPTAQPNGSTALPPELQLAWLTQVAEVWRKRDKLGQGIAEDTDEKSARVTPSGMKFLPEVESVLADFVRPNYT